MMPISFFFCQAQFNLAISIDIEPSYPYCQFLQPPGHPAGHPATQPPGIVVK